MKVIKSERKNRKKGKFSFTVTCTSNNQKLFINSRILAFHYLFIQDFICEHAISESTTLVCVRKVRIDYEQKKKEDINLEANHFARR